MRGGAITGFYGPGLHGFVRARNGEMTLFDVPGGDETIPVSINAAGAIAGVYEDAAFVRHGFARTR